MARYKIITLVDITRANPDKKETDPLKIGQQSNFNSLLQAIGLRSNVTWVTDPKRYNGSLPSNLEGKAVHWIWEFDAEREDVFTKIGDPVGLLKDDLHGVPVIDGLNNSVDLAPSAFQTHGDNTNIWINIFN